MWYRRVTSRISEAPPAIHRWLLGGVAFLGLAVLVAAGSASPAPAAAPKAYVGLFKDNAVAVIDTSTNRVLGTIPVPPGPHGLVITPDGRKVYVSSDGASTVSVIDTATDRVVRTIEVGPMPHGLSISRDGRRVLVSDFGGNQAVIIDTASDRILGRVPIPQPHNSAISPNGRIAYVGSQQPGATALVIVDLWNRTQVGTVPLDKTPRALNMTPDGKQLYFTLAGSDAVQVLDTASNRVVAQIPVGASPHHPIVTSNGKYGLVVSQGPGVLTIFAPTTDTIIGTVTVGKFPHWIATSADGDTAYVTNEGSNDLSVVDIEQQKVIATIPIGNGPRKITVQPGPSARTGGAVFTPTSAALAPTEPAAAPTNGPGAVRIASFAFGPATVKIAPGQSVTWTNADAVPHTTSSTDGRWNSGPLQPGTSYSVTFDHPGTYVYGCMIHPFMRATVVVGN